MLATHDALEEQTVAIATIWMKNNHYNDSMYSMFSSQGVVAMPIESCIVGSQLRGMS